MNDLQTGKAPLVATVGKQTANVGRGFGYNSPKTKVLIVEDDTPVAMFMVNVLSRAGCEVQVAHTGKKGLELAQDKRFDLITLDIDLPDLDGLEICREIRQRHISRNTPVVFISAQPCEENAQRALEVGAVDYISKPFEVTDFIFRILSHAKVKTPASDFPDQSPHLDPEGLCNTAQGNQ